jgi:hypothetical protein
MSDQGKWLNEILDVLGLPQDTAHRDYTRELVERCASLEQSYRALQSRMTSRQRSRICKGLLISVRTAARMSSLGLD